MLTGKTRRSCGGRRLFAVGDEAKHLVHEQANGRHQQVRKRMRITSMQGRGQGAYHARRNRHRNSSGQRSFEKKLRQPGGVEDLASEGNERGGAGELVCMIAELFNRGVIAYYAGIHLAATAGEVSGRVRKKGAGGGVVSSAKEGEGEWGPSVSR